MIVITVYSCIQVMGVKAHIQFAICLSEIGKVADQSVGFMMGTMMLCFRISPSLSFTKGCMVIGHCCGALTMRHASFVQCDMICALELPNFLLIVRNVIDNVFACVYWGMVYINSGLYHWFHQWASHLGFGLAYCVNSTVHLDNL